ncbi:MAG: hypothetical protein WC640_03700 [Candidatus Paceibacterota bacterium]|jgi:hypothetical protein
MLEQPTPVNNQEKRKYNFPEIMEAMKPGLVSLVRQLKDAIESGEYQTLISDEAKGRIPTLILRKIFKAKAPNSRDLQTYFLAFGRSGMSWDSSFRDYVKENKDKWGKALIVTEFINEGKTIRNIWKKLDFANKFSDYDIVSVFSKRTVEKFKHPPIPKGIEFSQDAPAWDHKLFIGEKVDKTPEFLNGDSTLINMGGVARRKVDSVAIDYSDDIGTDTFNVGAFPERLDKLKQNPEPKYDDIIKYKRNLTTEEGDLLRRDYDKQKEETQKLRDQMQKVELPEEELREIQYNINKAREDVDTMAQEIMAEVWAEN